MATSPGTDRASQAQRARSRAMLFTAFALVLAGLTAYAAWWAVSRYEEQLAGVQRIDGDLQVVVAARDLRPGTVLVAEDLTLGPRPPNVPLAALFSSPELVVGTALGERTLAGEVVRAERLVEGGADLRVNEVLDPGTRAVTIRTNHAAAVGGLLRPGFYVDVIVTIRPDTKDLAADWVTQTILQGVRVIAVNSAVSTAPQLIEEEDETTTGGRPREIFVTVEVEPAEAEQLALAAARGQVHLALRSRDDFDIRTLEGPLVTNALVGLPPPVRAAQTRRLQRKAATVQPHPEPDPQTTEVIRGKRVSVETFDDEGRHVPKGHR